MLRHANKQTSVGHQWRATPDLGLQILLWLLWVAAVCVTAYLNWHADLVAGQPVDIFRLVLRCVLVELIGLIVITRIEMRHEPWRFLD